MTTKEGAEKILRQIEATYVPTHRYVTVDARNFKHLDLAYYDKIQRFLESKGFRWLTDKEDLTLSEAPGAPFHRVMIRVLTSADGKTSAGIYHPKVKAWWLRILLFILGKRLGRVVDFESEFSDGSFVCTTNAMAAGKMSLPKQITAEFFHRDTPVETLLNRHLAKIVTRASVPGVQHRLIKSDEDSIAMQNRMNAMKSAYRGEIGGITREKLDAIAPYHPDIGTAVYEEIQILREAREPLAQQ